MSFELQCRFLKYNDRYLDTLLIKSTWLISAQFVEYLFQNVDFLLNYI